MRKFVQPRRRALSRHIIVRTESKRTSEWKLFFYYHWQKIVGIGIILFLGYLAFFYNRSPIARVTFTQETYNKLDYDAILNSVSDKLIGKGYFKVKFSTWGELISEVRKEFPIVKTIEPISFNEGTLNVDIEYNKPDFIAQTLDNSLWYVYHNGFIPYVSGSALGDSGMILGITINQEGIENYSGGVFWELGSQDLVKVINQITFLPKGSLQVTYYPGWEKLKVVSGNGTFIISLDNKILPKTFEKRENLIPYMPTSDPYSADISDPDRIIIKQ